MKEIDRIDKIEVKVIEPGQECSLMMNKDLSTPYNCALRKSIFKKKNFLKKKLIFFLLT
jgi:hypothetical protein